MAFKDHFSRQSTAYTQFRPHYPRELFAFLAEISPSGKRAWDCATGNGQAAGDLADFFEEVIATDPSLRQIASAVPHKRVTYLVSSAEDCPLDDRSVDLVTVAQAVHWFDFARFYAEVRRVCRPSGVIAVWCYGLARISPEVDAVVHRLYGEILGEYWPPERGVIEQNYATIPFPFPELPVPRFTMTAQWNLEHLLGYLGTWSSTQAYLARHSTDPVQLVEQDLAAAWGPHDERDVHWTLAVRLGRVE